MKNCEGINMYKKNLVMLATVVMMVAFVSACGNGKQEIKETAVIETMKDSQEASENAQIANPWIEVKTMEEAKNMAGFDLKLPEIPAEYGKKMIQVLDSADALTIEVIFWNNEDKVFLATWTEDGYTYSMYVEAGISEDEMTGMAGQVC